MSVVPHIASTLFGAIVITLAVLSVELAPVSTPVIALATVPFVPLATAPVTPSVTASVEPDSALFNPKMQIDPGLYLR